MKSTRAAVVMAFFAAMAMQHGHAQTGRTTWHDYGGSPDNARYFTLNQINKSTLSQLAVAWTYPTLDNVSYVFNPIVVDNTMYVLARNNSLVALDATHRARNLDSRRSAGHRAARHQLLGEQGPLRSAAAVSDEQLSSGDRRADGQVDYHIRQRRRRQSARRARPRPGDDRQDAVVERPGRCSRTSSFSDRRPARTTWRRPEIFARSTS